MASRPCSSVPWRHGVERSVDAREKRTCLATGPPTTGLGPWTSGSEQRVGRFRARPLVTSTRPGATSTAMRVASDAPRSNSSFYRPHAASTYARWRDGPPRDFLFAVKMPRTITHELTLRGAREPLVAFLSQTEGLAQKRGPILVQLPPSLAFDERVVTEFLSVVREMYHGAVVCEPRHATWFSPLAVALLDSYRSREWRLIRHPCRVGRFQRVGRESHIFDCTAHRENTGRNTTTPSSQRLRRTSATSRRPRRSGVCSTIPRAAPPSKMLGICANV